MSPGDESQYSMPTIERFEAGEFYSFIYGTDYGAPIHEWLAVAFRKILGHTLLAFRFPVVIFGSFAAGAFFLSLRRAIPTRAAFALALLVACPPSSAAVYTTFSHPAYAATLLFVGVIQLVTFRVDSSRTVGRWALLGLIMGAATYVFKLSLLQSGLSLLWLFARSPDSRAMRAAIATVPAVRKRAIRSAACVGAALVVLAPVAYHALTRRATYQATRTELLMLAFALLCALAAVIIALPLLRVRLVSLTACAVFAGSFAILVVLPALHFSLIEKPQLIASGRNIYGEPAYALKHFHEWPLQVRLLAERVFPALLLGRVGELEPYPVNGVHCGLKTAFSVFTFGALGMAFVARKMHGGWRRPFEDVDFVIIAPFFLVIAIMMPSWSLHGDFCYRYLLLFFPGFLLFAYRCAEPAIYHSPKTAAALLALYLIYAAIDCESLLSQQVFIPSINGLTAARQSLRLTGEVPPTPGRPVYLPKMKSGDGLRAAWYRDVVRPQILAAAPLKLPEDKSCEIHASITRDEG